MSKDKDKGVTSSARFAQVLRVAAQDFLAFANWLDDTDGAPQPGMGAMGAHLLVSAADKLRDLGVPIWDKAHGELQRLADALEADALERYHQLKTKKATVQKASDPNAN